MCWLYDIGFYKEIRSNCLADWRQLLGNIYYLATNVTILLIYNTEAIIHCATKQLYIELYIIQLFYDIGNKKPLNIKKELCKLTSTTVR